MDKTRWCNLIREDLGILLCFAVIAMFVFPPEHVLKRLRSLRKLCKTPKILTNCVDKLYKGCDFIMREKQGRALSQRAAKSVNMKSSAAAAAAPICEWGMWRLWGGAGKQCFVKSSLLLVP